MKTKIATSRTIDGIQAKVNAYWYSKNYHVNAASLAIEHPERPVPEGYMVAIVPGGYEFRHVSERESTFTDSMGRTCSAPSGGAGDG